MLGGLANHKVKFDIRTGLLISLILPTGQFNGAIHASVRMEPMRPIFC
jgi:hypothetical protein